MKTKKEEKKLTCLLALYLRQQEQIEHSAFQKQCHPEKKTISVYKENKTQNYPLRHFLLQTSRPLIEMNMEIFLHTFFPRPSVE